MKILIRPVDALYFNNPNINMFVDIIYNNFKNLAEYPDLKHNRTDIYNLLKSSTMKGYIVRQSNKILGYLIGEDMILADGRKIYYVSYIFITESFRNKKLGSKLIDIVINNSRLLNFDGVMLTCDTEDSKVFYFYQKLGFMPDLVLRRYNRHDVMYLQI